MAGGSTDRCKDCARWHFCDTPPEERAWGRLIDGYCDLFFLRGYLDRKPPHFKWSMDMHCFQFERKPDFQQTSLFKGE